jgi:hypothetical protein
MTGRRAWAALAVGVIAALAYLVAAIFAAQDAARGLLCAFVLASMVPIGSLALLLSHGVSGGRWGTDLAPVLVPAARSLPLLLVAALPILVFRSAIYSWDALHLEPDVRRFYLNAPFFDARTLVALALWSVLAWTGAYRTQLFAGIGLAAHLVLLTFLPADWVLTLPPGSTSAGFGAGFGVEQMYAALAFAAVVAPQGRDARANRDLAGLLVSTLLGTIYFAYMQFLIPWYGNIPEKVAWFAARGGWSAVVAAAFALGIALPFLLMLHPFMRRDPRGLRVVGVLVLSGAALHVAWLTAPAFGPAVLLFALLALLAIAALLMAVAFRIPLVPVGGPDGG